MTEVNIRPTEWYRRWFGSGKWPGYEYFYMWKKRRMANAMRGTIARNMEFLERENFPIYRVEIDLVNRCNCDCSFCPQSRTIYKKSTVRMNSKLFEKIMRELGEMNYSHSLYLSCNFEPLLDKDIIERSRIARMLVRNCYLLFFTNGLSLTPERYHALMKSLSMMFIDNYTDGKKMRPALAKVVSEMTSDEAKRTVIYMRLQNEVLDTIAGEVIDSNTAPARKHWQTLDIGCTYPLSELQIYADGTVHLCSKDVKQHYTFGDLNFQSIKEVWNSEKFMEARREILTHWRKSPKLPICSTCDFVRRNYDETMELNQIYTKPVQINKLTRM